jgi:hypothetical protein
MHITFLWLRISRDSTRTLELRETSMLRRTIVHARKVQSRNGRLRASPTLCCTIAERHRSQQINVLSR